MADQSRVSAVIYNLCDLYCGRYNMPRPLQVVTEPILTRFSCKEICINKPGTTNFDTVPVFNFNVITNVLFTRATRSIARYMQWQRGWLAGWLTGCLSVTRRYYIKTAKPNLKATSF